MRAYVITLSRGDIRYKSYITDYRMKSDNQHIQ